MDTNRRATLEAGRKKLEEFRRRKEAALGSKKLQSKNETNDQGSRLVEKSEDDSKNREEELQGQVAELLASVDGLHRSLQDERFNSSQLESQIEDLREKLAEKEAENVANANSTIQDALVALQEENALLTTEIGELKSVQDQNAFLKQQIGDIEGSLSEFDEMTSKKDEEIKMLLTRNGELEGLSETLRAEMEEAREIYLGQEEKVKESSGRVQQLEGECEVLRQEAAQVEEYRSEVQRLYDAHDAAQEEIRNFEEKIASLDALREDLEGKLQLQNEIEHAYEEAKLELEKALSLASSRQEDIEKLRTEIEEVVSKMGDESVEDIKSEYENRLQEMESSLNGAQTEIILLQQDIAGTEGLLRKSEAERDDFLKQKDRIQELEEANLGLKDDLQVAFEAKNVAEAAVEELTSRIEALDKDSSMITDYQAKYKSMEANIESLMSEIDKLNVVNMQKDGEMQTLSQRLNEAQEQAKSLEANLIEATSTAEEAITQKEDASRELQSLVEQTESLVAKKESLEAEKQALQGQIESLLMAQDHQFDKEGEIASLQAALDSQKAKEQSLLEEIERLKYVEDSYEAQVVELENSSEQAELRAKEYQVALESSRSEAAAASSQMINLQQSLEDLKAQVEASQTASQSDVAHHAIREENSSLKGELASLRAKLNAVSSEFQALQQVKNSGSQEHSKNREQQFNTLKAELQDALNQLELERRRVTQLEGFINSRQSASSPTIGNKKNEDDGDDMEAAALAGGTAFKPLVGLIRSLPAPFGSNAPLANAARKVDKAAIALDARPHLRALLLLYIIIVHILMLV
eukprot:jgi/Picsp_1/39/NSC_00039-R1_hypothetical protein CHLNCDRAFT_140663 [Chlorella variabilis]